jgi:hypothetical protein
MATKDGIRITGLCWKNYTLLRMSHDWNKQRLGLPIQDMQTMETDVMIDFFDR